jgi:endonuclease-3
VNVEKLDAPDKRPFDVEEALAKVRDATRDLPRAVLFALADDGFGSPFEQLVACIISVRTLEEVTEPAARALFARARTPAAVAALSVAEIDALIGRSTFHEAKAPQILAIARAAVERYGGELPCDEQALLSFRGVGPKCANLVLTIACGEARIGVDTHVHRVVNRWGYIAARSPEATLAALEARLPREHWGVLNRLLVPFGKYVCTPRAPKCSTCPVLEICRQVGVTERR